MTKSEIPLKLLSIPMNGQLFLKRLHAPKYNACFQKLAQQQESCYFCKQQNTSLYIINLDHNYHNNDWQNLTLACGFCSYVQLLDLTFHNEVPKQYIIYLPTKSQETLNHYYHQWQTMVKQKNNVFAIQEAILELSEHSQPLDEIIGFQANFKDHLGLLLKPYADNHPLLSHLRWLPSFELLTTFQLIQ
ncbi:hypothetical protein [Fastidiosibacter lacustris]|uniref:hypothetical protein n=1 Tax=Fastidiosibacter lacustris TaxID=2056695 RepID=UPI000E344439|nr:hypothetical protein [Fastidiosibacter lacustris]